MPELEINSASVRLKLDPSSESIELMIPEHALPVDPEAVQCKFSKKRGELVIEWPCADVTSKPDGTSAAEIATAENARAEKAAADVKDAAAKKAAADKAAAEKAAIEKKAAAERNAAAVNAIAEKVAIEEEAAAKKAASEKAAAEIAAAQKAIADMKATAVKAAAEVAAAEKAAADMKVVADKAAAEKAAAEKAAQEAGAEVDAEKTAALEEQAEAVSAAEWKARGNAAIKTSDHDTAIACYTSGIAVVGCDVDAEVLLYSNRALCFHKVGRYQEAVDDAMRCVDLKPNFIKGHLRGAMALRALKRPAEAHALLRRAPNNEEACALAAEIRPEAEAAQSARIQALPEAERAKEEGNVMFKKGLFDAAAIKYSEALGLCEEPEGSLALAIRNNRAACYHQVSDFSAVVKDTNFVLERDPRNFKALVRRMLALEPMERYELALEDARAVLSQDPRNEMANKVQHRLGKLVRDLSRA